MKELPLSDRIDQVVVNYRNDPFRRAKELKKLLKEAEKTADLFSIGKANMFLANCFIGQGKRGSMLSYAFKAVSIFEEINKRALLARSYNLLGIAYAGQGNYQRAITAYKKGLQLIRGKNYTIIRKDTLLNNLGDAYFQMGAYQKSLQIACECYNSYRIKPSHNPIHIVVFGMNVCDNYCCLTDFQKAKDVLDEIAVELHALPDSNFVCGYYVRLSYVYYMLNDFPNGDANADRAIEMIQSNYDSYEFHHYLLQISSIQMKQGDLMRASHISKILKNYAAESKNTRDQITAKRVEANLCSAHGDNASALSLNKEISELYEMLLNENKSIQYESQKNVDFARTEIGKLMAKIRVSKERADRDSLTGLLNRSALVNISGEFIQMAKERGKRLGGIFFDIDYFKEFNDTYGHAAGDEAIKLISNICMSEETATVKFFRYGGDEYFGIVLGYSDEKLNQLALRISEKVRSSGVEHIKNPNGQRLTVSIGTVNVDMKKSSHTILDIIRDSDLALYHAKDSGKDNIFAFVQTSYSDHSFRRIHA